MVIVVGNGHGDTRLFEFYWTRLFEFYIALILQAVVV